MAWPPPLYPLSVDKTNLTAQVDDHPAHHNALAQTVNDAVGQIDDVDARLGTETAARVAGDAALLDAVTAVETDLTAHLDRSWIPLGDLGGGVVTSPILSGTAGGPVRFEPGGPVMHYRVRHGVIEGWCYGVTNNGGTITGLRFLHGLNALRRNGTEVVVGTWYGNITGPNETGILNYSSADQFILRRADGTFHPSPTTITVGAQLGLTFRYAVDLPDT